MIGASMHPEHIFLCDHLKDAVSNKWDGVALIDGIEGSGKSGLAFTTAFYLDPTFCIDRVVFTPEQFMEAVDKSKAGQCIVWDEFVTGGLSADFMSQMQKALVKKMTMIRKKRLFILWVMPYFFMVGKYFAVARSRFLLHSYTPDGIRRGAWRAWNYERKKTMYFRGKREFDYCTAPYKKGTFPDFFGKHGDLMDEDAYEKKKEEATRSIELEEENPRIKKLMIALAGLVTAVRAKGLMTAKELSEATGYTRTWIYDMTKGGKNGTEKD